VTQHLSRPALRRILELQTRISSSIKSSSQSSQPKLNPNVPFGLNNLTNLSVTGLNEIRRLIVPDALMGVITGEIIGSAQKGLTVNNANTNETEEVDEEEVWDVQKVKGEEEKKVVEKLRRELDDLLAGSCVLCDKSIDSLDKTFVLDGEFM
jgi:vacuolar protein sorting-associated protein 18